MGETVGICESDFILAKSMFSNLKDVRNLRQRRWVGCEVEGLTRLWVAPLDTRFHDHVLSTWRPGGPREDVD